MNTKKVVFNKLFSTEAKKAQKLSKQRKISLSLMDKMESYLDSINDESVDSMDVVNEAIDLAAQAETLRESINEVLSSLDGYLKSFASYETQVGDLLDQYRSAADDLGISPEDNDTYNALSDALTSLLNNDWVRVEDATYDLKQYIK
jgi:ABC-type transporter Mla subunit MlaD